MIVICVYNAHTVLYMLYPNISGVEDSSEGGEDRAPPSDSLPITPNYMAHPPVEYKVSTSATTTSQGTPVPNGVPESNGHVKMLGGVSQSAHNSHPTSYTQSSLPVHVTHHSSHPLPHPVPSTHDCVAATLSKGEGQVFTSFTQMSQYILPQMKHDSSLKPAITQGWW